MKRTPGKDMMDMPFVEFLQLTKSEYTQSLTTSVSRKYGIMWAILLFLASKMDKETNECITSHQRIADELGVSRRTVSGVMPDLLNTGVLTMLSGAQMSELRTYRVEPRCLWKYWRDKADTDEKYTRLYFSELAQKYWMCLAKDNGATFAVLIFLILHADATNFVALPISEIAKGMGIGKRTAERAISCLISNGIVSRSSLEGRMGLAVCQDCFWAFGRKDVIRSAYRGPGVDYTKMPIKQEEG